MSQNILQYIIDFLHNNPHSAGMIVFFIAFSEALAVVGTIVPGSITMTAVGILIGSKAIPLTSNVILAVLGAISGDFLSYWIGRHYQSSIHKIWPFTRYPHWLEKGETFFRKHGGKSILLGRFFGPIRCLVPLIAGSFNMGQVRFLIATIPSAAAWAIGYMIPGILIGALSLELPSGVATEFIISVLIILALIIFTSWLTHHSFGYIAGLIDQKTRKIWRFLQRNRKTHWFTILLTEKKNPQNHNQLILVFYAIISGCIFLWLAIDTYANSLLYQINYPLSQFFLSLRTDLNSNVGIAFTVLGSPQVMLGSAILIFTWLAIKKYWRAAIHLAIISFLAVGSIHFGKSLFYSPRPGMLAAHDLTSSFPSGHTCLTITILGFLAVLISSELPHGKRGIPYLIAIIFTIFVALSRMFLGAHWLTDVLGGVFLGITIILLTTLSYRRSHVPAIPPIKLATLCSIIVIGLWLVVGWHDFKKLQYEYTPVWPVYQMTQQDWHNKPIILLRNSRTGHPAEIFNLEWFGDIEKIKQTLISQGWKNHDSSLTFIGILRRLSDSPNGYRVPLIPQLYNNQYPSLLMTKDIDTNKNNYLIMLRLWPANIKIEGINTQMWLGIVNYYQPRTRLLSIKINGHKKFLGATDDLIAYLKNYKLKQLNLPLNQQTKAMQKLNWDGKLLIINTK